MTQSTRRSGFRLPWSAESDDASEITSEAVVDQSAPTEPAADATAAETAVEPVGDGETVVAAIDPTASGVATPAPAPPAPDAAPAPEAAPPPDVPAEEGSSDFLRSLVDAMRSVAEEERVASVTELRRLVDERAVHLETRARDRAEELRRKSELDITAIGDWQKAEIERINAEAARKVEARRQQLEQQLADHETRSAAEVESVRDRVAAYERELEAFFAQLADIADPASFVAAARRMPKPPSLEGAATPVSTSPATPTASLNARLAQLGIDRGAATAPSAAPGNGTPASPEEAATPVEAPAAEAAPEAAPAADEAVQTAETAAAPEAADTPDTGESSDATASAPGRDAQLAERLAELDARPEPSTATAPADATDEAEEVATAIMVKGLGSFGAITSFKQRLERLATVRSVTLSLGPTGEFVYRATHPRQIDLSGAISTLEPGSTVERQPDGSLRVTVQPR